MPYILVVSFSGRTALYFLAVIRNDISPPSRVEGIILYTNRIINSMVACSEGNDSSQVFQSSWDL